MKYPRQENVIERIEKQNQREMKKIRDDGRHAVQTLWETTKHLLRVSIRDIYRKDFGRSTWTLPMAKSKGTLRKIEFVVDRIMDEYHREAIAMNTRIFREVYRQTILRNAYVLDLVTPNSYDVTLPRNRMFTEAASVKTYQGPDAETAWKIRWSAWTEGYKNALNSNIKLGALNDSVIDDVENEVDASRAGSPAYDMADAFDRIVLSQAVSIQAIAQHDLAELNPEMQMEEIWQTSFSARVCDTCDSQKGLLMDEAEFDIPAHPNCECYWRLVPADFADLLRDGDADDLDLAKWMDANGIVPSSMVVRNDDGDIVAKAMVTFEDWVAGNPKVVMSR